jgi:hypothetical protein
MIIKMTLMKTIMMIMPMMMMMIIIMMMMMMMTMMKTLPMDRGKGRRRVSWTCISSSADSD